MDKFNLQEFNIGQGKAVPFDSIGSVPNAHAVITVRDKPLIPIFNYSVFQNVKKWHPGMSKRHGLIKFKTTRIPEIGEIVSADSETAFVGGEQSSSWTTSHCWFIKK